MDRAENLPQSIPLLIELGKENLFEPQIIYSDGVNKWCETPPITLGNNYCVVCVDLTTQPYRDIHNHSGLFLYHQDPVTSIQTPVGYATYPWINGPYAEMEDNPFNQLSLRPINTESINPLALHIITKSSRAFGMQIFEPHRKQGLGKMLFLMGAAYLQLKGCEKLRVIDDATIHTNKNGVQESFYMHLGACEVGNGGCKDFNINNLLMGKNKKTITDYFDREKFFNPESRVAHQLRIFE